LKSATSEPRFARIAATIGDATRARTLSRLLDGRHYTATELATHEHLIKVRAQGRHRYFTLADGNVAHALEALLRVADSVPADALRWQQPHMHSLRHARTCYGHMAGELGVQLRDALIEHQWVAQDETNLVQYRITPKGIAALGALGCDVSTLNAAPNMRGHSKRVLYDCMDWSERRDHFAGPLAIKLLEFFIAQHWVRRDKESRGLVVTVAGEPWLQGDMKKLFFKS
jgi:DNA-binding transcriptional ArsR family regulator